MPTQNNSKKMGDFFLLLFMISISAFRLNLIIAGSSYSLILIYSIIKDKKIIVSSTLKWGIVFWGYYLLSLIWTPSIADTLRYISAIIYIIGIFIFIPKIVKTKEDVLNAIILLFYSLAFTAVFIIILTPFSQIGTQRMGSILGLNENTFGMRMAIGSLIAFYLLKIKNVTIKKGILGVFLIIFMILSLLSGSRKALIIDALGIICLEFFLTKGFAKVFKFSVVILFLMVFMHLIFSNPILYSTIGYRVDRLFITLRGQDSQNSTLAINTGEVGTTDKSLVERQFFIAEAIKMFKEKPIFGGGGNSFMTRMRKIGYSHVAYSHNNYTEMLCTLGIVGFIIYYYKWFSTLLKLLKIKKLKVKAENLSILFSIILILFLIMDYAAVSYIMEFNMLLLCLVDIYIYTINNEYEKNSESTLIMEKK